MADPVNYRIPRQRLSLVRDGSLQSSWQRFANSREAFDFARERLYADADREQFHVGRNDGIFYRKLTSDNHTNRLW